MYWRVSVCVRLEGGRGEVPVSLCFLCVPSTLEQKPRHSGLRFKSNKLLQHFRDDIWRYQHAKPGRGWPTALPTQPWELPLPRLRWGDLYQCRALKYHGSAPPTPLPPVYASLDPQTDWLTHNSLSLTSCYPFSFHTGLNASNCVFFFYFSGLICSFTNPHIHSDLAERAANICAEITQDEKFSLPHHTRFLSALTKGADSLMVVC